MNTLRLSDIYIAAYRAYSGSKECLSMSFQQYVAKEQQAGRFWGIL
jgi:hypothetical protein